MSAGPGLGRSKSEPPPIVVEDTESSFHSTQDTQTRTIPRRIPPTSGQPPKRKPRSTLEWRENRTAESWAQGRVLLIDYISSSHVPSGRRKIKAQEFGDIDSLRRFYRTQETSSSPSALRVIHVQNAPWATRFLLRKFNIDASDDLVGTTFGRWARYDRPQMRGGKPVLSGKTFRAQRDPWRGVGRTAFGADYLKYYDRGTVGEGGFKIMELNRYDEEDVPCYGFDVLVQRLSVYVQFKDGAPDQTIDPDIPNPYDEEAYDDYQRLKKQYGNIDAAQKQEKYIPKLQTLDNNNTIIIFENSQSGSVKDTLIGARQELESRWRRLSFYLPRNETTHASSNNNSSDHVDNEDDDTLLATTCMNFILRDIFNALSFSWQKLLSVSATHVGILEDKIYENPADESRAPELYQNSALWLKAERLLYIHVDMLTEMRTHLLDLAGGYLPPPPPSSSSSSSSSLENRERRRLPWTGESARGTWLATSDLERLPDQWDRDVIAPTTALSDLMYKSVGIRDARHSLQLGLSMWRLSWITFIFLPLTFTVGFFGMNVDTFSPNEDTGLPRLTLWFIVSVPILVVVLLGWYVVKHSLASQRQHPLRRGVYESLYHDLALSHPSLWTRRGPRQDVRPVGVIATTKWRLLSSWFGAEKVLPPPSGSTSAYDPSAQGELGTWSRIQRSLVRRWLPGIAVLPPPTSSQQDRLDREHEQQEKRQSLESVMQGSLGAMGELLSFATPVAIAEADAEIARKMQGVGSLSPKRHPSPSRSPVRSEGEMEGVMVEEEKGVSEDERSEDGQMKQTQRLDVPR